MEENKKVINTIDEYIAQFPPEIQEILQKLRKTIKEAAPDASEKISWEMPTFVLSGHLVYFAAFKNHISFFPMPSGVEAFKDELKDYKTSKGTVQFPNGKPIPFELVSRMVKFRVAENNKIAKDKLKRK